MTEILFCRNSKLCVNLFYSALDVLGLRVWRDDDRLVETNLDKTSSTKLSKRETLKERITGICPANLGARGRSQVLHQIASVLTETRCTHSNYIKDAAHSVLRKELERVAFDSFGNNKERNIGLVDHIKNRRKRFANLCLSKAAEATIDEPDVGAARILWVAESWIKLAEDAIFNPVTIYGTLLLEVTQEVLGHHAAVELEALCKSDLCATALALFKSNGCIGSNLIKSVCDNTTNLRITIGGDRGHTKQVLNTLYWHGLSLDPLDDTRACGIDAAA